MSWLATWLILGGAALCSLAWALWDAYAYSRECPECWHPMREHARFERPGEHEKTEWCRRCNVEKGDGYHE